MRLLLLASLVAALGYMLLPDVSHQGNAIPTMIVLRCLVAGCVAGLTILGRSPRWASAAAAAAGIVLGTAFVALVTPVGVFPGATVAGMALGCGAALLLSWLMSSDLKVAAEVLSAVVVIAVMLWLAGVLPGAIRTGNYQARRAQISVRLQPKEYSYDGTDYLRTYYLMKGGEDYYAAFHQAVIDDSRHDASFFTSPFNYREPFVFYLWRALPGDSGAALWDWFVVYAVLVLICSYVLASSLVSRGVALLAPVAMVAWFFYLFWTSSHFLLTEVWAAGFGVAAVMCLVRKWQIPSVVLLTAAVAAREFMVVLIPAWLLAAWFSRNRKEEWWFPTAAVLGPTAVLAAHFLSVPHTSGSATAIGTWLHGGPVRLINALSFGFDYMPAGKWISLAIAVAAIAGAALARPKWKMTALLAATVLPTLFLLVFSAGVWQFVWGGFYIPLAISVAPGVLGRLLPAETALIEEPASIARALGTGH